MTGIMSANHQYLCVIQMNVLQWGHTLDNQVGSQDTHGGNADSRLRGTVGGAEAGENDGRRAAHSTEERLR